MFEQSRLFRLIIDEVEKTLLLVDPGIMRDYASLVADASVRDTVLPLIEQELSLTREMVLKVSGGSEIAERFPAYRANLSATAPHRQRGQSRAGRAAAPFPRRGQRGRA